ncbi:hypothetical protein P7C71_g1328, partial [Lecanoromycetidae sp. Uapishka_2]
MLTSFINQGWFNNDVYILFMPFGTVNYYGTGKDYNFTQEICQDHWVGDKNWPWFATCDLPFGLTPGMAILTRPSADGWGSDTWANVSFTWRNGERVWSPRDVLQSSMVGAATHGFGYNLTSQDFSKVLTQGNAATQDFTNLPLTTPGLFNLAVCVVKDLAQLPANDQVQEDMGDDDGYHETDPCDCGTYTYSVNGQTYAFVDYVSAAAKKSVMCTNDYTGGN